MAKQMTDEQKLFFGTKAQRKAMIKKHPGWAKDKSGFRQTIRGKRNPFKKAVTVAKKVGKKVKKITLATINAKIRKGLKLNAADSAWIRKHQPTDAYLAYTIPVKPSAPSYTKKTNGGGSSVWKTGDQLLAELDKKLAIALAPAIPGIGGLLGGSITGGTVKSRGGETLDVKTAGLPGFGTTEPVSIPDAVLEIVRESNTAWMESYPGADVYGLLDPTYAIA